MKSIFALLFSLTLLLGYSSLCFAADGDEAKVPVDFEGPPQDQDKTDTAAANGCDICRGDHLVGDKLGDNRNGAQQQVAHLVGPATPPTPADHSKTKGR